MRNIAICLVAVSVLATVVCVMLNRDNGIVALHGYAHGVAICGVNADEPTDIVEIGGNWFREPEGYMWAEGNIMYTVNAGHMGDSEVSKLKALAILTCAKYNN